MAVVVPTRLEERGGSRRATLTPWSLPLRKGQWRLQQCRKSLCSAQQLRVGRGLGSLPETSGDTDPSPVRFGFCEGRAQGPLLCPGFLLLGAGPWLPRAAVRGNEGTPAGAGRIWSSPEVVSPSPTIQAKEGTNIVLQCRNHREHH